jgi:exodeoxyribonuclease VII large subunit
VFRDPLARLRTQMQRVDELGHRMDAGLNASLARARRRLEPAANQLAALHPAHLRERAAGRLSQLTSRLAWALGGRSKRAGDALAAVQSRLAAVHPRHRVRLARQGAEALARQLEAMSYRNVIERGFSVTRDASGGIVRFVRQAGEGELIQSELIDGLVESRVTQARLAEGDGGYEAQESPTRRRKAAKRGQRPTLFDAARQEPPQEDGND